MTSSRTVLRIPLVFAAPLAVLAGFVLRLAFPHPSWWVCGLLGVMLINVALWNQKGRHGLWLGLLSGGTFWLLLIDWLTLYLGPVPWAALAGIMMLWFALMGGLISYSTRVISLRFSTTFFAAALQTIIVAGLWVAREGVQSTFPYGGFPWGRLAHTQSEGPLTSAVSYLGFAGLTGLVVLLSTLPVAFFFARWSKSRHWNTGTVVPTAVVALIVSAAVAAVSWLPTAAITETETARIAAVQGNSKSGVFDDRENGDVIADHVAVTRDWLATDQTPVDAVVWPENSAEFNLTENRNNMAAVRSLVRETGAPFVVGSILGEGEGDDRKYTNSSLIISPDQKEVERFDKRHPVPFAEYMPHRAFYGSIAPNLVNMVQLEYEHGTTDTSFDVGSMRAGMAICFDIIFDDMAVAMHDSGAEIIFAPTNNADFGYTDQSEQQLQIAHLRAVEMGRTVVHISTVATSAMIAPSGEVIDSVPQWQPGVMAADVPLASGTTPAIAFGAWIAAGFMIFGLGGYTATLLVSRKTLTKNL